MSSIAHQHGKDKNNAEHGSIKSYVVGFLLSLILTFIPYFMVVNQVFKGTALLTVILGFALAQLVVQVVFFLHLGRGPKPNWNLYFFISTIGIILVVVGGSIFIINNLIYNMLPSDQSKKLISKEGIYQINGQETGACSGQYDNHKVIINNGQASPQYTLANKCDTLTFVNEDSEGRELAFGEHPNHDVYAGENLVTLKRGRSKTIVLSETGEYQYHDHEKLDSIGYFIVSPEKE
jgi:cytochrome o ubiquinol oxidase subunit IV